MLLGNGNGTFAAQVTYAVSGCNPRDWRRRDLNGDGKLDLVVSAEQSGNNVFVLLNSGTGTFPTAVAINSSGGSGLYQVVISDLDGDGRKDLPGREFQQQCNLDVLGQGGTGTFSIASTYTQGGSPIAGRGRL